MSTECLHPDSWFDRTICPDPCGSMHHVCTECGLPTDECVWRSPEPTPHQREQEAIRSKQRDNEAINLFSAFINPRYVRKGSR